ncbi:desulfoferrodoxin [Candidatus Falkowbacteria bacterium RIFOXYB2_FULL_34_18]|uniref:Desulfoferrodoxin n=1 Tax=Candidatus Falkowbacteria bacterium RIFOXYD2_FULL_34_120 TaxID=1798007 RepID=A0A1F5TNH4_9BACT|nr:MAG: desulfoferrodoxin [Candidatus Falkowbacteria bacterium RIFOXYC12_FULL_34_55]OGF28886.1 MAG: desulfoferrodoxin [Candidatus Falkowbacteria bacterium RIFOXYB2_FULL_34_18]OGF35652.1 MAG: desulfoferrodoxin [Candidatus Falkowbacteria bacterium RIFOXYC2_FULL_34_220]OGF38398.1 MAG: desulfoferrodoxin [Candidatus Falkowbacteria bacterium RIFOXYD12_FULL_34_57]OGF40446.1 MAG: desulfoferrodoxin [Candidatus Falkowbacteria bacterium RIFOXYD2_FULL_34_120]
MTKLNQIYKCNVCGNIVNVIHEAAGELVCCGQPMELLKEKTQDEGREKHLPVIEKLPENICKGGDGVKIKIGAVPHPMEEVHYIEWVEIKTGDGRVGRKFLKPGEPAEVEFHTRIDIVEVRAYCNVHGLWKITI